jgi:hypothetical protein
MSANWKEAFTSFKGIRYKGIGLQPLTGNTYLPPVVDQYVRFWDRNNKLGRENLRDTTPDNLLSIEDWFQRKLETSLLLLNLVYCHRVLVGHIGLTQVGDNNGQAILNLTLYNGQIDLRGKGIMSDSVVALFSVLKACDKNLTVLASANKTNSPSLGVVRKTMHSIGESDTHFHFGRSF